MKWKAYSVYKESNVEWLGKIPSNWNTKKLKFIFSILNGATPSSSEPEYWDGNIPWATPDDLGNLNSVTLNATQRMISKDGYENCGTTLAPLGSLILSTRAPIGYLAIAGTPMCTNQGCRSLVIKHKDNERYFYYQLLAAKMVMQSFGQGSTFKELSSSKLGDLFLCSLDIEEQKFIATFLDLEAERIDNLIAKKQRQIELLQEKCSALISHVVTKGIDPNVKMKDSGVEWLGKIPGHWVIKPLGYALNYISYGFTNPMPVSDDGPFMLTANDICDGYINYVDARRTSKECFINELTDKSRPHKGDILMTKDGTLGRTAVFDGTLACINQSVALIRVNTQMSSVDFIQNALRSSPYQSMLVFNAGGTTIKHLYISRLTKMPFAFPSEKEEQEINQFINYWNSKSDEVILKIQQSITNLQEYRISLITAAVTGKIDVRQEVS